MDKEFWASRARQHTINMAVRFKDGISNAVKNTKQYRGNVSRAEAKQHTQQRCIYKDMTSENAVIKYADKNKKICVLNFASYKNPGGQFLNGVSFNCVKCGFGL